METSHVKYGLLQVTLGCPDSSRIMIWLILFWVGTCLLAYVYVGYALAIRLLSRIAGRDVRQGSVGLTVTVVVAAYNEERGLRAKLDNLMALDYPADLLDVVVASDGSVDGTDAIAANYGNARVRLLRVEGRQGKTACQNRAAEAATGEIIVFTDATTILDPAAIRMMVRNFADPEVGCVAARLLYLGKGQNLTAAGGTAYWGYEIALRQAESRVGSLVGVSGCLYAVRRSAYRPIRADLISDFVISMVMRGQGLRAVLEGDAVCYEDTLERSREELPMRVRVAIRSIAALVSERRFLNPLRYGMFAVQLISHKLLRYASPILWAVTIVGAAGLASQPFYLACLAAHLLIIVAGTAGFILQGRGSRLGVLGKPYYFLLTNVASLLALQRYLRGERVRIWNPLRN